MSLCGRTITFLCTEATDTLHFPPCHLLTTNKSLGKLSQIKYKKQLCLTELHDQVQKLSELMRDVDSLDL